jgi:chromosomal replication initiation ATPase DnaA
MGHVIRVVANYFAITEVDITKRVNGPQKENEARKLAMYFCQELVTANLTDIAARFHLSHVGSVSFITHPIRKREKENSQFRTRVEELIKSIVKQAT